MATIKEKIEKVKEVTEKLEAGIKDLFTSEKYTEYLRAMSKFHNYSTRNTILIYNQYPKAKRVAGYKMWQEMGRYVKNGEKGIQILAPVPVKIEEEKEKLDPDTKLPLYDNEGKKIYETIETIIPRFIVVYVYDISQTDGEPLPALFENLIGNVQNYDIFIEALKQVSPLPIEFEPLKNQDGVCHYGEKISIREGMSEIQTICAIIHEIAHAKLHDIDALREKDANAKPKDQETKEVESESIAFTCSCYYGIETDKNSFGYIAEFSRNRELPELKASLEIIRKTSAEIIDSIDEKFIIIAKERGIDLTAEVTEQEITPPEQIETVEQQPVGYLYFAASDEKMPYYSDNSIIEAYKNELYSLGISGVVFQDVADETLKQKLYDVYSNEMGVTSEPLTEIEQFAVAYYRSTLDTYRHGIPRDNYEQIQKDIERIADLIRSGKTDGIREGLERQIENSPFPAKVAMLLEQLEKITEKMKSENDNDILPDPAIGISGRDKYGYTNAEILPLLREKALELFDKDHTIYMLYPDNTEAMIFERDEILNHDGIFGIESSDWLKSKEYAEIIKLKYTAETAKELNLISEVSTNTTQNKSIEITTPKFTNKLEVSKISPQKPDNKKKASILGDLENNKILVAQGKTSQKNQMKNTGRDDNG